MKKAIVIIWLVGIFTACVKGPESRELPIMGKEEVLVMNTDGEEEIDTIVKIMDDFSFLDQEGTTVTEYDVKGKVYVVDFFFTSCPTICPKMKAQMLRVYEEYESTDNVAFLSHSIDTYNDSVPVLNAYAKKMGIKASKWHLLTGEKEAIFNMAERYMISAEEDPNAPGGFIHSGAFILLDKQHRLRAYYDGVNPEQVDQLIVDIETLLSE